MVFVMHIIMLLSWCFDHYYAVIFDCLLFVFVFFVKCIVFLFVRYLLFCIPGGLLLLIVLVAIMLYACCHAVYFVYCLLFIQ